MSTELKTQLEDLQKSLDTIGAVLNIAHLKREINELEGKASDPNLWDDPGAAQKITSKLSLLQNQVAKFEQLSTKLSDSVILLELATGESDASSISEVERDVAELTDQIRSLEVQTLMNGEFDERDALMTIRAEAGGVDAADWAAMLLRMYLRYCERHNWSTEIYDTSHAEEAGIKSVTFRISAPYAYGTLSVEQGTHRLVRISPFDSQNRRHTSFAGVEVIPVVEQSDEIEIADDELRVDVYRSSGPGGQGVNTTDSAVRITHIPTGIVVACQNERSQLQNKATALGILQAKLLERKRHEEQAKIDALKGDSAGSWGAQIRNYVLHPYQMVKDARTDCETGNTSSVLDGEIDDFIEAGIRWRKQS